MLLHFLWLISTNRQTKLPRNSLIAHSNIRITKVKCNKLMYLLLSIFFRIKKSKKWAKTLLRIQKKSKRNNWKCPFWSREKRLCSIGRRMWIFATFNKIIQSLFKYFSINGMFTHKLVRSTGTFPTIVTPSCISSPFNPSE